MFLLQGKARPRRQPVGRIRRLAALGACAALAAAPPGVAAASGPPVPVDAQDDGLSMVPATAAHWPSEAGAGDIPATLTS
ncbi:MAG: hypothetical protein AAB297_02855, partial [Acidobacteriota bacterium]